VSSDNSGYRVGIDVGGTFTDLICVSPEGHVVLDKTPTTPDDQSVGVMTGVDQLAQAHKLSTEEFCSRLDALVHGTTTADNTMIEMDGAPTGLLVTEGHRDEIELRRVHRKRSGTRAIPLPRPSRAGGRGSLSPSGWTSRATWRCHSTREPCATASSG
jgi:N-methylhydantoinase A